MEIGLDLDGVVANWCKGALKSLNERFGYNFDEDIEPPTWDWIQHQVKKEEWEWLWRERVFEGLFYSLRPYPNATSFYNRLAELGKVIVMTTRPKGFARVDTYAWLNTYGVFPSGGILFSDNMTAKSRFKVDVLIEDNVDAAEAYAKAHGPDSVILLDRAYNQAWKGNRAKTYDDVLASLESWMRRQAYIAYTA